jgi:hypothetical protein
MTSPKPNKLLHVLVVVGAAMTGGVTGTACSAGVDARAARDAAADDADYGRISPAPGCDAGNPQCYGKISTDGGNPDAYPMISPAPLPDAGDASDAGDALSDAEVG